MTLSCPSATTNTGRRNSGPMSKRRGTQGVNLAFWSGNEVYWKVRWETSIDGNGTPYRTMVCYKETWGGTPDPSDSRHRYLARPTLCRSRTGAGELADRNDVHGRQLPAGYDHDPLRLFQPSVLAEHRRRRFAAGPNLFACPESARLRMGLRRRERVPAGGSDQSVAVHCIRGHISARTTARRLAPPMSPTA